MKAVVAAFNQEKALVGAFSVITNLRMELFEVLTYTVFFAQEIPTATKTEGPADEHSVRGHRHLRHTQGDHPPDRRLVVNTVTSQPSTLSEC